jgi:hypothetical protein
MFHWMYISHFVGPFCWWTFCLHPRFNYCDQCWYEHGGRSFNLHFPCKVLRIREVATCPRLQPEIVQGGFWTWVHLTLQLIFVSTKIHTFAQGVPKRGVEEFFFFFAVNEGLGLFVGTLYLAWNTLCVCWNLMSGRSGINGSGTDTDDCPGGRTVPWRNRIQRKLQKWVSASFTYFVNTLSESIPNGSHRACAPIFMHCVRNKPVGSITNPSDKRSLSACPVSNGAQVFGQIC